ncbi:MAG: sulfurtransferase-like selenium metabolism protein YedF [Muricoprocola sp.]
MITVNAMGDACPIPVIKTQNAIKALTGAEEVEVLVDNEVAVQNLTKLAGSLGCGVRSEKKAEKEYCVVISVGEEKVQKTAEAPVEQEGTSCIPDARENTVIVIASNKMGDGEEELGKVLMKGYLYALTQLEKLPKTILFYNSGAFLTCEGSTSLEDLKSLEAQGVEILTCGTCLNFYGLTEKLQVGSVTNMYVIAEKMSGADKVVKP